ncbi:MAG: phosphonoacetaldehyde hydrolase [Oscillospiraceae bacterium]|jgi:phosphonoacetaldehyde hydrolase|nr:phosphonoacetaldehyde hydrolase [Oscillospiraceae bacterium]
MAKIRAVILDWAGTTVDFGCFAPLTAFAEAFGTFGIEPDIEETRAPMGLAKRAHIEKMLEGERISALWREKYEKPYTSEDVDKIYAQFEPALFRVLSEHAGPLPDVVEIVHELRGMGILIGSTTGYTRAMMDVVTPIAAINGYAPDSLVCPDDTGGIGRPYPYMLWRNLEKLGIQSISEVIKIGDTAADIQEGKNAGCLTVGVLKGSSMMGLNETEFLNLSAREKANRYENARREYKTAGADFVVEDIRAVADMINQINGGIL